MRKRDLLAVTRSELAQHTTRDSCWVAVGSNVYDVTDYLDQHKSGAGIQF
jgi:L-lactate dehydrogenase (cytochrome)